MRIVLSADMEGIAGITGVPELLACCPEYWDAGRRRLTDDVVAAARGLLDGGATEVLVLDNHGSGHPVNILVDELPSGTRLADHNVFDLPDADIDGMLQVGYHPRNGVAGYAPHTYIPGLRLWVDGEEISESHGRAWAARTPLLGITGHANHRRTLGSLDAAPFLATQDGSDPHRPQPLFAEPATSAEAIRSFAREAVQNIGSALLPKAPHDATFVAELAHPDDAQALLMHAAGWLRHDDATFSFGLRDWAAARDPLAAAMRAAMTPFIGPLAALDMSSRAAMIRQEPAARDRVTTLFREALRVDPRRGGARPEAHRGLRSQA